MQTQGKTLPWSFEQDFETESGLKAGILEEKQFSNHLWIRFVEHWAGFVVVVLFWQGDMNLSEEISWFLSRKSV